MVGSHAVPREHSSGRGEECTCVESAAVLTALSYFLFVWKSGYNSTRSYFLFWRLRQGAKLLNPKFLNPPAGCKQRAAGGMSVRCIRSLRDGSDGA